MHKVVLNGIPLLLLVMMVICVYPASADITSGYTTEYDASTQKIHTKVTLAGGGEGAQASEYPRDFVILMDVSLSTKDVYKDETRLDLAKNATIDFLESLYAYKSEVGIVTFSDGTTEVCPLTFNFEDVKGSLEKVSAHGFSTDYGSGIRGAVNTLKGRDRAALPVIIMLTDGGEYGPVEGVESAVEAAAKEGVLIYVLSFGERGKIDGVMLREKVAAPTGGEYRYSSFEGLSDAIIETTKMEEFLSAANVRIAISQNEGAVLDFYSIPSRLLATSGVIVTAKDKQRFVCPKLSKGEEIIIEFDAFSAEKGGEIIAGVVDVYYTGKDGAEEKMPVLAECSIPNLSPPWGVLAVTLVLFVILLLAVMKWREEKKEKESKISEISSYMRSVDNIKKCVDDVIGEIREIEGYIMSSKVEEQEEITQKLDGVKKSLNKIKEGR